MAYAHFERLSAMDMSFLGMEDGRAHMHIGSVSIFDAEPLRDKSGGLDFERILTFIDNQLHKVPRLQQRLEWVPGFGQPVWVDDAHFNLRFHVRHTALPPPGDIRQLKRMAGRILSQEFDRRKPLWEDWFVDGLEGNRFALIGKIHHCMADGKSGVEMGNLLVGSDPNYEPSPRKNWLPRPAPSPTQLLLEEVRHRVTAPIQMLRELQRDDETDTRQTAKSKSGGGLRSLFDTARDVASGASDTPLNVEVGPHRRFDWTRLSFDEVHAVAASAGGTVNDVVLSVASGAISTFLRRRGVVVDDLDFRAIVPVSVRRDSERKALGNRVSGLLTQLPLDENDPWKRLLRVIDTTHELKSSGFSDAGEIVGMLLDLLPPQILNPLFQRAARASGANLVITNVPGPRHPVYLLGARQLDTYPVVPLAANQALGIALMSYDEGLYWGFNADWDAVPDLHDLAEEVNRCFEALKAQAPVHRAAEPTVREVATNGDASARPAANA